MAGALVVEVDGEDGRARALTLKLGHGPVRTPVFMPVGTKGAIKGISGVGMSSGAIGAEILLGNTYHLAFRPGADVLRKMGGLHRFMNYGNNILTDSGGFQMVSLLSLAEITEEGVRFQSPSDGTTMMLTPEESIRTQHKIGSDIIMVLDDVVHSCTDDMARFKLATDRTVRWLDRCIRAHREGGKEDAALGFKSGPDHQNIFAIVQGGLDVAPGGLREQCLEAFAMRDEHLPGYAIGGLAGGESKEDFWRVVDLCCRRLPKNKPRYLMGVGYPLDIVVCTALGVDMFDCVYPTRTARFGTAFTRSGLLKLKSAKFAKEMGPIDPECPCEVCQGSRLNGAEAYSRASLHFMLKHGSAGGNLLTHHNLTYMLTLVREMRAAIIEKKYPEFVRRFLADQFTESPVPQWVVDALHAAGIDVESKKDSQR